MLLSFGVFRNGFVYTLSYECLCMCVCMFAVQWPTVYEWLPKWLLPFDNQSVLIGWRRWCVREDAVFRRFAYDFFSPNVKTRVYRDVIIITREEKKTTKTTITTTCIHLIPLTPSVTTFWYTKPIRNTIRRSKFIVFPFHWYIYIYNVALSIEIQKFILYPIKMLKLSFFEPHWLCYWFIQYSFTYVSTFDFNLIAMNSNPY